MLSIADIGKIKKPIVWTLHDMWAFCGAEHYSQVDRWRSGYNKKNRPTYESGFDINRWTWLRKLNHWHKPIHIVSPSNWLANCVRESKLMNNWPVSVVPNLLNTDNWKPKKIVYESPRRFDEEIPNWRDFGYPKVEKSRFQPTMFNLILRFIMS